MTIFRLNRVLWLEPQPFLLEGSPSYHLESSFRRLDTDRQQMQSQIRSLQEQQKEVIDGKKIIMVFLERFPKVRQHEIVRDPMTSILVIAQIARGDPSVYRQDDLMTRAHIPGSPRRSIFPRLGKQVLLDNQIKGVRPEDIIATACRPTVSQGVLSFTSVTSILRWRHLIILSKSLPRKSLEGRLGRHHTHLPDPLARRPVRISEPPRHKEGRVEDRPADSQRIGIPAPMGYLSRLNIIEKILLDKMEEQLYLKRGGQDKVYQPLGGEPLTARIKTSRLPVGWITLIFSRFDRKGDPINIL